MRRGWLACLVAVTLVGNAALLGAAQPASASLPQLTTTGSSFAGVAITQWQGQFNELYGGNINFTVSSSIIGMNDFCSKTVDYGATDISYSTEQSNCITSQVPYPFQYMPDVAGGLAFEYNLAGQNGQAINNLVLNDSIIVGIFTGGIQNWDNPAIQALNPDVRLPNEQITAYYRSDPSGENYLLSDYMLHTDPAPITAFQKLATIPTPPGQPSATWASFTNGTPAGLSSLVPVNGSDAASQGPVHQPGGIAYVETAYAKNVGLPVASVVNAAGNAVQPSSYNVAVALTGAILYSDLTQNLGGVYTNPQADAYPISAYSYFVAQCVPAAAAAQSFSCDSSGTVTMGTAQGAELAQFITYVACLGQENMAQLGYSPLPANLVEDDFQAAGRLPGGTEPAPPTAANCKNPYIDGQLQPVGNPQQVNTTNPGSDVGTTAGPTTAAATAGASAGTSGSVAGASGAAAPSAASPAAAAAQAAAAKDEIKRALNPLAGPGAYKRADAIDAAASGALLGWSPVEIALWCSLFALLLVGVPLGVYLRQRRRPTASR
jgi:phosphate transport system substrate-binding protein